MLLEQEVHYYMIYFAYFTKLDLQISDYAKKRIFLWLILPSPNGCQLLPLCRVLHNFGWIGISYIYERSVALWAHQGLTFSSLQFTIIKSDGCVFYKTKCSYIDRSYVQHWTCSKWSHVLHRWSMALITHTTSYSIFHVFIKKCRSVEVIMQPEIWTQDGWKYSKEKVRIGFQREFMSIASWVWKSETGVYTCVCPKNS